MTPEEEIKISYWAQKLQHKYLSCHELIVNFKWLHGKLTESRIKELEEKICKQNVAIVNHLAVERKPRIKSYSEYVLANIDWMQKEVEKKSNYKLTNYCVNLYKDYLKTLGYLTCEIDNQIDELVLEHINNTDFIKKMDELTKSIL